MHRVVCTPAHALEQDTEFLLLSPFTSSPCEEGPSLNQNLTGLDSLAGTHLLPVPSDDAASLHIGAQLPTWLLGIQFARFQRNYYPLSHLPAPSMLLLNMVMKHTFQSLG